MTAGLTLRPTIIKPKLSQCQGRNGKWLEAKGIQDPFVAAAVHAWLDAMTRALTLSAQ